jgi:hypothetical protein
VNCIFKLSETRSLIMGNSYRDVLWEWIATLLAITQC